MKLSTRCLVAVLLLIGAAFAASAQTFPDHNSYLAAAALVLATSIKEAAAKLAQAAASYQDEPKDDQRCGSCSLFQRPSSCQIVEGTISPSGWCKFWVKESS
jgi:hypothetical protein